MEDSQPLNFESVHSTNSKRRHTTRWDGIMWLSCKRDLGWLTPVVPLSEIQGTMAVQSSWLPFSRARFTKAWQMISTVDSPENDSRKDDESQVTEHEKR